MKKIVALSLLLAFAAVSWADEPGRSFRFREYMHEIYQNYITGRLAIQSKRYDVADIHFKSLQEYVKQLPNLAPSHNMDGTELDKGLFLYHAEELEQAVSTLREALKKKDADTDTLPQKIFGICVGCHTEVRLTYLFRTPKQSTLFSSYMHEISENFDMAELSMQSHMPGDAGNYLAVAEHYLSLLESVLPEEGPTGVVMDRKEMQDRVRKAEGYLQLVRENIESNKGVDFKPLKNTVNGICSACHQPGRIE